VADGAGRRYFCFSATVLARLTNPNSPSKATEPLQKLKTADRLQNLKTADQKSVFKNKNINTNTHRAVEASTRAHEAGAGQASAQAPGGPGVPHRERVRHCRALPRTRARVLIRPSVGRSVPTSAHTQAPETDDVGNSSSQTRPAGRRHADDRTRLRHAPRYPAQTRLAHPSRPTRRSACRPCLRGCARRG